MGTELIVVRHGETAWNAGGRIQGHRPVGLNARGRRQARAVAARLAGTAFDALYSSDLDRAMQTADAVAGATGHEVIPDARLREWDLGVLAGLTAGEAESQYPDAYGIYRRRLPDAAIPEGESIRQRYARTTQALEAVARRHDGGCAVVVTHGGPLDDFYRRANGIPLEAARDFELFNAGLNTFRIAGEVWTLVRWGDIDHLREIGSMGNWEGR